jgi:hypothetical protein
MNKSAVKRVPYGSIWDQVAPLVARAERPSRYINHEWGSVHESGDDVDFRFCMVYPDTYEIGQANQALRILVNAVNARPGMAAERGFVPAPEMCGALREAGLPLFSIEGCAPLVSFDAVGITLPHELAATNVLEALDLGGIPVRAADRAEGDPIVVGGGPCAYNPEPYAPFFDAINIGEGEESLPEGLERVRELRQAGAPRHDILKALAALPGWYVPSLYRWRSVEGPTRGLVDRAARARPAAGHRKAAAPRVPDELGVGAVHRAVCGGSARPPERRDTSRLRARVPLLPGGHDVPPRARALRRQHRGRREARPGRNRL